jgi:hypothetical protein
MTAFDLIESIFARAQRDMPGNERRITFRQLVCLKDLIGADEEGSSFRMAAPGEWIWAPAGRNKYVISEDRQGNRHKIARLANLGASGTGRLF